MPEAVSQWGAETIVASHFTQCASIIAFILEPLTGLSCIPDKGNRTRGTNPLAEHSIQKVHIAQTVSICGIRNRDEGPGGYEHSHKVSLSFYVNGGSLKQKIVDVINCKLFLCSVTYI